MRTLIIAHDEKVQVQSLKRLGLSIVQAKIYLSLVKAGSSSAKTISQVANVGRADIYRVMPSLQGLGLVEKLLTSPIKFKAIPPQNGLQLLIENKKKEYTESKQISEELLTSLKNDKPRTIHPSEEAQFILIPHGTTGMRTRAEAIKDTKKSLDVIHSWKMHLQCEDSFSVLPSFTDLADKVLKRGVKIRIVVNMTEDSRISKTTRAWIRRPNFQVKFISSNPLAYLAVHDSREVFLSIYRTDRLEASPTLWSNNPALLSIMANYFENLWISAERDTPEEYRNQKVVRSFHTPV